MRNGTKGLRGSTVFTVVLTCLVVQVVFTLPAYGDEIVGWGDSGFGAVGYPGENDFTAIAAGQTHGLALKADGSIVGWGGGNASGQATPPGGFGFTAIAAGKTHNLALTDGSIVAWGSDHFDQLLLPVEYEDDKFTAIAADDHRSYAIKSDGSIIGWGRDADQLMFTPPGGVGFTAISAGDIHGLALKADGSIVGWGSNHYDQSLLPVEYKDDKFTAIAAGGYHSLALKDDGSVVCWGRNNYGQSLLPVEYKDDKFTAIAAGEWHSLALKTDGSIVCWGGEGISDLGQATLPEDYKNYKFTAIAAGDYTSFALMSVSQNSPPIANAGGPYLVAINDSIMLDGSGSDDPDGDVLSYFWNQPEDLGDFDDETLESPSFTGVTAGVTELELWVADGVDTALDSTMLVVYDSSGGFVTGGGWIDSPSGAYTPENQDDDDLTGKASFGFVSKYKKGASVPTGNTEFTFRAGNLNFHSSSYQWLVVNQGGTNAQFKGSGSINGAGDFRFMLRAGDGGKNDYDTFRIKVWEEDAAGNETVIYDNGYDGSGFENGQPIGGGSIVIHKK